MSTQYVLEIERSARVITPSGHLLGGRHKVHDSRSKMYAVAPTANVASITHRRYVPVFDQGRLGACTGYASVGALGTGTLWESLSPTQQAWVNPTSAIATYSAATHLDNFPGTYLPTDTGSDGLSVAKALLADKMINGYRHCFTLDALNSALQVAPVITGVPWYEGMENPDANGRVTVSGNILGGHEFVIEGTDVDKQEFLCRNSWGTWGLQDENGIWGRFTISWDDFATLMGQGGDVTALVAVTAPAPTPTPPPPPTPSADDELAAAVKKWLSAKGL